MTPREETARIIMPQSGVRATPHKGLITEIKDKHATVGRLSDITYRAYIIAQ